MKEIRELILEFGLIAHIFSESLEWFTKNFLSVDEE